jgi:hypothetical protein
MEAELRSRNCEFGREDSWRKLVRIKAGEILAAWTLPGMSNRKKGKMSFLGNREVLREVRSYGHNLYFGDYG